MISSSISAHDSSTSMYLPPPTLFCSPLLVHLVHRRDADDSIDADQRFELRVGFFYPYELSSTLPFFALGHLKRASRKFLPLR
jgi:hypothetical protein